MDETKKSVEQTLPPIVEFATRAAEWFNQPDADESDDFGCDDSVFLNDFDEDDEE